MNKAAGKWVHLPPGGKLTARAGSEQSTKPNMTQTTKQTGAPTRRWQTAATLAAIMAVIYAVSLSCAAGADAAVEKKKTRKKLTGSELYAVHCSRCHPERYATERTEGEWKTLAMHMRVRANLPAGQVKTILKYLQEDSGK